MASREDIAVEGFTVLAHVRTGGMGAVYRVREIATGRVVALKVLVGRLEEVGPRFAQEAELLSTLAHPNIIGYIAHGLTRGGAPFLAMPWLDGEDLHTRLGRGPLTIDETLRLARSVADALAYLHDRGFVHRDLKPSNLFLPGSDVGDVKIIDLGIAHGAERSPPLTLSGALVGTPEYMAPEQARGDRTVTPATDVFSLGCVLFECLTGTRLFAGAHLMAILGKILIEDATRVRDVAPQVPRALDALLHAMVEKEPSRRPRDGATVRMRLDDVRRAPPEIDALAPALTLDEQRVVSVLVIVQARRDDALDAPNATGVTTKLEGEPLVDSAARFGVRLVSIDPRTSIALAQERVTGTDPIHALARFARHFAESDPDAILTLSTGTGLAGAKVPVGEAIDRGVALARAARSSRGVHVDDASAALLEPRFHVRTVGALMLLEDERAAPDPTRPLLGRPTACVGRDGELALLAATFADCVDGAGPRVVQITAPAGAGKSRVRHELLRRVMAIGPRPKILSCNGDPLTANVPLAQLAQLLRRALSLRGGETHPQVRSALERHIADAAVPGDRARVAGFLAELLGAPYPEHHDPALDAARHSAEAMADQTRLAFQELLLAWCMRQPVIVILEDMHWADSPSLELLDHALRALDGAHLLVVAIGRPEVRDRFSKLWEHRALTRIALSPLAWGARLKIIRGALGDDAPREVVLRIAELSEGNAFYLEELVRDGAREKPTAVRASPLRPEDLPATILAFAQSRLERLEPNARKLLRAASVLGETFPRDGIFALVGGEAKELDASLALLRADEAIAREEVDRGDAEEAAPENGRQSFVFRHGLLRSAAYASLTERDRMAAHRAAAAWLHEQEGDLETVGLHWLEGREPSRAATTLELAARQRWSRSQAEAAARCAMRALLLVDVGGDEPLQAVADRVRLLADALESARRLDVAEVVSGLEPFLTPEAATPSPARLVRLALDRALTPKRMRHPSAARALAMGACALALLSDFAGADEVLARAEGLAGDLESIQCVDLSRAKIAYRRADMKALHDALVSTVLPSVPQDRITALLFLATSSAAVGGAAAAEEAFAYVAHAAALGEQLQSPFVRAQCARASFLVFVFSGKHAEAALAAEEGVRIARASGLRYEECMHLHNAGEQWMRVGERERARAALVASTVLANDLAAERLRVHNTICVAYLNGAAEELGALAEHLQATGASWHETHARYWLGLLYADRKDARARATLTRARELAEARGVRLIVDDCTRAIEGLLSASI